MRSTDMRSTDMRLIGVRGVVWMAVTIALAAACAVDGSSSPQRGDSEGSGASGGRVGQGGGTGKGTGGGNASGGDASNGDGGTDGSGTGGAGNGVGGGDGVGGTNGGGGQPPAEGALTERLRTSTVTVSAGVKAGVSNWRIWDSESLGVAPVFTVPLANCGTLVCFTSGSDSSPKAHVALLDGKDQLVKELVQVSGFECRGLAAEADGHFAALLWADASDKIFVRRYDIAGAQQWSTELRNDDNTPDDFGIGESRLEFGNGRYGAYYHVHSNDGHEGDTLKWVDVSGKESTEWDWGCSHSMSNLLRFNPEVGSFLPACVTDCYPGTNGTFLTNSKGGIYLNHRTKLMDVDGACNGKVAGELGSAALSPNGWKVVFNAHQNPTTLGQKSYDASKMNQDVGFVTIGNKFAPGSIVWLTNSAGVNEADSSIARWQPADDEKEQYVVGWLQSGSPNKYLIGRVDADGKFLEGPSDLAQKAAWGRRDDPFRTHYDQDLIWAWFDKSGSTSLHVARVEAGRAYECKTF